MPEAPIDEVTRQQIVDDEQLRLLRMGYFVAAGMTAFVALIGILYAILGFAVFSHLPKGEGQSAPPEFIGSLIGGLGVGFAVVFLVIVALQIMVGQRLKERRSRIFCMVMAGILCLSVPFGTFLGVCTFIVLSRPTVVKSFQEG